MSLTEFPDIFSDPWSSLGKSSHLVDFSSRKFMVKQVFQ